MTYNYDTWYGPYHLNLQSIDQNVLPSLLGNYCLSLTPSYSKPTVDYVGRAHDEPVHDRLLDHLTDDLKTCESFWVMYKRNAMDTYNQECYDYHKYNPILNKYHPAALPGVNCSCPITWCDN